MTRVQSLIAIAVAVSLGAALWLTKVDEPRSGKEASSETGSRIHGPVLPVFRSNAGAASDKVDVPAGEFDAEQLDILQPGLAILADGESVALSEGNEEVRRRIQIERSRLIAAVSGLRSGNSK